VDVWLFVPAGSCAMPRVLARGVPQMWPRLPGLWFLYPPRSGRIPASRCHA